MLAKKGTYPTLPKPASPRKARAMRAEMLTAGICAEINAVNAAIQSGVKITMPVRPGNLMSGRTVISANYSASSGIWVRCANYGGLYALANDSAWGEIVALAGVTPDPRAGR